MSCYERARSVVNECADKIEQYGDSLSPMRSVDATESSRWLHDMAIELRKACEEDLGIPGWHRWLDELLTHYGHPHDSADTTAADIGMREVVETAFKNHKVLINRLEARVKELEEYATGPVFTSDKE